MKIDKVHRIAHALTAALNETDPADQTTGPVLHRCATNAIDALRNDLTATETAELERMTSGTVGRMHAVAVAGWLNGHRDAATLTTVQHGLQALQHQLHIATSAPEHDAPTGVYL